MRVLILCGSVHAASQPVYHLFSLQGPAAHSNNNTLYPRVMPLASCGMTEARGPASLTSHTLTQAAFIKNDLENGGTAPGDRTIERTFGAQTRLINTGSTFLTMF